MPGDVLMALAQFAGQTVATAAVTDVRERTGASSPGCLAVAMSAEPRSPRGWSRPASSLRQRPSRSWTGAGQGGASSAVSGPVLGPVGPDPDRERDPACWWRKSQPSCPLSGDRSRSFDGGWPGREDHGIGRGDRRRGDPRECSAAGPYVAGSGAAVAAPGTWILSPGSAGADRGGQKSAHSHISGGRRRRACRSG